MNLFGLIPFPRPLFQGAVSVLNRGTGGTTEEDRPSQPHSSTSMLDLSLVKQPFEVIAAQITMAIKPIADIYVAATQIAFTGLPPADIYVAATQITLSAQPVADIHVSAAALTYTIEKV